MMNRNGHQTLKPYFWNTNLYDIWGNQGIHNHKMVIGIFKQRVIDNSIQKWYSDLENINVLSLLYKFI